MRAPAALAVLTAVLLAAAGCSDSSSGNPSSSASSPSPAHSTATPTKSASPADLALEVPKASRMLVREVKGTGSKEIREFQPGNTAYTVFAICSGSDSVTIHMGGGDDTKVPCDGMETVGQVYPDAAPQRLSIDAAEAAVWKFAVVSGAVTPQS